MSARAGIALTASAASAQHVATLPLPIDSLPSVSGDGSPRTEPFTRLRRRFPVRTVRVGRKREACGAIASPPQSPRREARDAAAQEAVRAQTVHRQTLFVAARD